MPPDDALPAWATEEVHLAPYDGMWPRSARVYRGEIDGAFGPWLLRPVEHVGSTAVPGFLAKPVIDLMAMVADPAAAGREAGAGPVAGAGLGTCATGARQAALAAAVRQGLRGRRVPPRASAPPGGGCPALGEQLRFREALRGDNRLRDEYAALKRRLAEAFVADREG